MGKTSLVNQKILLILLVLGLVTSLFANFYWYNSNNRKLERFSYQQYNVVLSDYENNILSTSQSILSQLESSIVNHKISTEEILFLYTSYEELNDYQINYANYVQTYNSPEGKKASSLEEPITLNYVPGFVYFNSSITLFKKLLLQNNSNSKVVVVTDNLEKRLKIALQIVQINTKIYEKFINKNINPLSDEAILTRLKLQKDLTASFTKLTELDLELSRLDY